MFDTIESNNSVIDRALFRRITTVNIFPRSVNSIGGYGAMFKFRSWIVYLA